MFGLIMRKGKFRSRLATKFDRYERTDAASRDVAHTCDARLREAGAVMVP